MPGHIGITAVDIEASLCSYVAAVAALGFAPRSRDQSSVGFRREGATTFSVHQGSGKLNSAIHVAFSAPDRAAVASFHAARVQHGGRDNGAPGPRADYSPSHFAAFLLDPDGNNVEAAIDG